MVCRLVRSLPSRSAGCPRAIWSTNLPASRATLYGAVIANLFCLPIADKLHGKLLDEETNRTLIIDGILMIRDSKSPTLVREMLLAYLPEKHRDEEGEPVPA